MNPQTIELAITLLRIGQRAYDSLKLVIDREQSGNPMTPAEIATMKAESDAAHDVIQGWNPLPGAPLAVNAFRLRFGGADDKAIAVRSTLDRTWYLAPKTDEQVQFARDDLVNIKNVSERRVFLRIQRTHCDDGPIVVRSTRKPAFQLPDETAFWFQPGEVLNIRSVAARNPNQPGVTLAA